MVDRLLVPFLFLPLWVLGLGPPGLFLPFAILDPVLAIGAYVIWRQEVTSRDASTGAVL